MGSKKSGNPNAKGQKGHRGGTGRPAYDDPNDKRTLQKRMSQNLWDKINIAAMNACEDDWHEFLEKALDYIVKWHNKANAGEQNRSL